MTTNLNRDWATDQQGTYESDLIEREISTLTASIDVIERQVAELINANKILVTPEMLKAAQIKSELGQTENVELEARISELEQKNKL